MKSIKNLPNKQQGFTLIELVVVIVILGILAVTAAPKFIDLTSDARESVMEGVKGSIESAVSLAHAKALIDNQTGATGEILIGDDYYALVNGYPAAAGANSANGNTANGFGITKLIDLDSNTDVTVTVATPALFQHSGASDVTECQLSYANAADSATRPVISIDYDKC
ncbi:MAG: type II secretion system protein [Litorilituus sp.]|nr:type II secretion system protein [Litorilituus sp.]